MPARDSRYTQVGVNSGGDAVFQRAYADEAGRNYDDLSKDELQALLKHMALPVTGNKDELIARLREGE